MAKSAWDRLLIPGTGVLKNKLNESDAERLSAKEYAITGLLYEALVSGDIPIEGETAGQRLSFIHKILFESIYDWAGDFRDVNMSKGGHTFGDHASMGMYMRQLDAKISRTPWTSLDFPEALNQLAEIHTDLNFAHPFREGNGRTSRAFMTDLATQHGIGLNFSVIDNEQWNKASADTFLDPDGLRLTPDPLIAVYHQIASPNSHHDTPLASNDPSTTSLGAEIAAAIKFGKQARGTPTPHDTGQDHPQQANSGGYTLNIDNTYGEGPDLS